MPIEALVEGGVEFDHPFFYLRFKKENFFLKNDKQTDKHIDKHPIPVTLV